MRYSIIGFTFIFVSIVIFLLFIWNTVEHFGTESVSFMGKSETYSVLTQVDYFRNFNNLDYKLRNVTENNVFDVYRKSIQDFTKEEKKALRWIVKKLDIKIRNYLPKRWCFIKTLNIEAEMPHTRGNCIVLPAQFISEIVEYKKRNKIPEYHSLTLIHEQVHVYQRQNPELFEDLYVNYWNFKHSQNISANAIHRNRTNPDGTDIGWYYRGKLLPVSIYKANAKTIKDVDNMLFDGLNYLTMENSDYQHFFGSKNNYHPNEISAHYFEKYFGNYFSKTGDGKTVEVEAYRKFKLWLNSQN